MMTLLKSLSLTVVGVLFTVGMAQAAPSAAISAKFGVCFACHGVDGHAILPTYPNLAGQNKDYLVQTLREFRDGKRPNDVMGPMAKPLSNNDIDEVAMYFADIRPGKK